VQFVVQSLVSALRKNGLLPSSRIYEAMLKVDRSDFCLDQLDAYADAPQPIGYGATISAPHMHARALELLDNVLQPGCRVLDVGSGSGYLVAVMAQLVIPGGQVYGIDHIPQLVDWSIDNMKKHQEDLVNTGVVQLQVADGFRGLEGAGPFDAIHVGAAAPELPEKLVQQLKVGGRMVIPVGTYSQVLMTVDKRGDGSTVVKTQDYVRFVPLIDKSKQLATAGRLA
jgi:protein-L-isoaspartate(D-aspartate) O-methyltransferase